MKIMQRSLALLCVTVSLTACGGGGGGGGGGTPAPNTGALLDKIATGSNIDNIWKCSGSDGAGGTVNFDQILLSTGEGSVTVSGETDVLLWAVNDDTSIQVTFPPAGGFPAETFNITNIAFSTVNATDDKYTGIDSRDSTALTCEKPSSSDALQNLLPTSNSAFDASTQWLCSGVDGSNNPITFNQQLYSNGEGQTIETVNGLLAGGSNSLTWSATGTDSIQITFPASGSDPEETFSVTNIVLSTVNSENDRYVGTDSRNSSELSCVKEARPPSSATLIERLTTGPSGDTGHSWKCDYDIGGSATYELYDDGSGRNIFFSNFRALNWTADNATVSVSFTDLSPGGQFTGVNFISDVIFEAVDTTINAGEPMTCTFSVIPNAPTPPPAPDPL